MLFVTNHLQSKWGFKDGKIFNDLLKENIPEIFEKMKEEIEADLPWKDAIAVQFPDRLLEIIIRKYILPKLPNKIILQNWIGHNPIRAKRIDDVRIILDEEPPQFDLKPSYIKVEDNIILEEAWKLWRNPNYINIIRKEFSE